MNHLRKSKVRHNNNYHVNSTFTGQCTPTAIFLSTEQVIHQLDEWGTLLKVGYYDSTPFLYFH